MRACLLTRNILFVVEVTKMPSFRLDFYKKARLEKFKPVAVMRLHIDALCVGISVPLFRFRFRFQKGLRFSPPVVFLP